MFNKNRLKELAGIPSKDNNSNVISENLRIFGMISPAAIGVPEDIEEEECGCPEQELSEISLNPSEGELKHIEHIEFELLEQTKVMIEKLELIGDYDNLDKAIELLQSMQSSYKLN